MTRRLNPAKHQPRSRGEAAAARARLPLIYCLVPPGESVGKIEERLRRHLDGDPGVEVLVERRFRERRSDNRRRRRARRAEVERRRLNNRGGRRVGDRRAALTPIEGSRLPRPLRPYADDVAIVRRVPPSDDELQELEAARLVLRCQAGEDGVFELIYERYLPRIYAHLNLVLADHHLAEDLAQEVLADAHRALPRYEVRDGTPFRAWLFRFARNKQVSHARRNGRVELRDPAWLNEWRETRELGVDPAERAGALAAGPLGWISDHALGRWLERLPAAQLQLLILRYPLGFDTQEIAAVLYKSPTAVRMLEHRALSFLREQLGASGRESSGGDRFSMRARIGESPVLIARRSAPWASARRASAYPSAYQ